MLRCRYRSAQEVQQRFSRKYQDSSAGRKSRSGSGSRSRSRGGEVLVQRCWCWCSDAGAERWCRAGAKVLRCRMVSRGAEVLRC